ncbi:MAG: hypothetical protein KGL39_04320 [Patescibacteria group bacterium]|nr:hypothetical protein [Patescibacteria group bacterium]
MGFNTNNTARKMRAALVPKAHFASQWEWAYVAAVHARTTTTLAAAASPGDTSIQTNASISANAHIIVGSGGPVVVGTVTGTGPYVITLKARSVPNAALLGATVYVLATVDVYLAGWQNPPKNLPASVAAQNQLLTGVRYDASYTPAVGHTVMLSRGVGMQRSDRVVQGRCA